MTMHVDDRSESVAAVFPSELIRDRSSSLKRLHEMTCVTLEKGEGDRCDPISCDSGSEIKMLLFLRSASKVQVVVMKLIA